MSNPVLSDLGGEHRGQTDSTRTDGLVVDVDPALGQEIFDVAQRQWYLTYIITT
jgi:hypothetical protein